MNALPPMTLAQHNAAVNARCPEGLDWADLGGLMGEIALTASFLQAEWNTRHHYRDHTTADPRPQLIRLACAMRELAKAVDAEESGE